MAAPGVHVEPALGGPLGPPLGHDTGRVRAVAERDPQHLVGRRHLQIERQLDVRGQPFDVRVGHVPPVLAEMGGDAVRAGGRGEAGGAHRVGMPPAAGVPDRRHVVDIHAKSKMSGHRRVPSEQAGISRGFGRVRPR